MISFLQKDQKSSSLFKQQDTSIKKDETASFTNKFWEDFYELRYLYPLFIEIKYLKSYVVWSQQDTKKVRVSVSVRVSQLCLVIDKHRHGVALVEVRHAGLAGLAHAGAARQHLHVVQPEE
mgnify:CR=1 FL=1